MYVVILSISLILSYCLVSYYLIVKKSKFVYLYKNYSFKNKFNQNYFNQINKKLSILENPYGLTVIKYLIIKYFLSSLIAIIIFIRSRHLIYSLIIFVIINFIPNLLIRSYIRKEKNYVINDLSIYISNLQIFLVVNNSLYDSLKYSVDTLNYDRLKKGILKFIEEYRIYNYNVKLASKELLEKFDIDELKTFIEILDDNQSNQNLVKLLSGFQNTLNEKAENKLKFAYIKDSYYIFFCIVLLLGVTFITVMYPVFTQVLSSLSIIFN